MAYDRNASARAKGYRNYYEYRQAQAHNRGFRSSRHITETNKLRQELPEGVPNPFGNIQHNPMWESQVPSDLQNSFRLQQAFQRGFLDPIGKGDREAHKMTNKEREERAYFLEYVEDFDWEMWREYVDEEGTSGQP